MSQERGQIVRNTLRVPERSIRTLDQRFFLRFPRLVDAYARLFARLPPTSRLRRAAVRRNARLAAEAFNRRDFDVYELGRSPDWQLHPPREVVEAGLQEPCYRGSAGNRAALSRWAEIWGPDSRSEPVEVIDLGDRLVVLGSMPTRGRASGVPVTQEYAWVFTMNEGKVTRQQEYLRHAEALAAVGLSE
jgi:ketosteroid isomerase-like protein